MVFISTELSTALRRARGIWKYCCKEDWKHLIYKVMQFFLKRGCMVHSKLLPCSNLNEKWDVAGDISSCLHQAGEDFLRNTHTHLRVWNLHPEAGMESHQSIKWYHLQYRHRCKNRCNNNKHRILELRNKSNVSRLTLHVRDVKCPRSVTGWHRTPGFHLESVTPDNRSDTSNEHSRVVNPKNNPD